MRFILLVVVLVAAATLCLARNRAMSKKQCHTKRGVCVGSSKVSNRCKRLSYTCPKGKICCKKGTTIQTATTRRTCRTSLGCLKVSGTCISTNSNTCASATKDDLCQGDSCTCCPNSLTKPICKTKKPCANKGGFCLPRWESSRCIGSVKKDLCEGKFCTCCLPECQCGVINNAKVVGGVPVTPNKYPWLVTILIPSQYNSSFCGGSIINDRYILTAAHCLYPIVDDDLYAVGIAEHNQMTDEEDIPGITDIVPVKKTIIHKGYDHDDYPDDIALLKLKRPLDLTAHKEIKPVCLPKDDSKTYEGEEAILAGWGKIDYYDDEGTEVPLEAIMPILNPECEGKRPPDDKFPVPDTMLCTVLKEGGVGTCSGDSGGPLVVREGAKHVLVGVTSFTFFKDNCANPNRPNVFTRVSKFLNWIREHTSDGRMCGYP